MLSSEIKILLTGGTGYIAQRLLPVLLEQGHQVVCLVRDQLRFDLSRFADAHMISVIEADLMDPESLANILLDKDAVYYLVHSMPSSGKFSENQKRSAQNFRLAIEKTGARQIIYLSGIVNSEDLSEHLASRKAVEQTLASGKVPLTTLRAGIIIGSGGASFEIIRNSPFTFSSSLRSHNCAKRSCTTSLASSRSPIRL